MKSGRLYVLLGVAVVAAILLWAATGRDHEPAPLETADARKAARVARAGDLTASAVLSIDVAKPSVAPRSMTATQASSLSQEFERARTLRPLYDRLAAPGGNATADAKFVLYEILVTCAPRSDSPKPFNRQQGIEKRKKALAESISDADTDKRRRLKLFDELIVSRCEGMESVAATTQADLDRLLEEAARDGDAKARAQLVFREMERSWVVSSPPDAGAATGSDNGPTLGDAQLQTLRDAIASRDPEAIVVAGTALSNSFRDLAIEIGPNHQELDGRASIEAWRLLACEYGLECGPSNRQVQSACVYGGQCGANTLADLVFFYSTTPYQSQLVDSYRGIFREIIESGDWSQMQFVRRPSGGNGRYFFTSPVGH